MAKKIKCIVKRPYEKVGHIVHTSREPIDLRRFIGEPIKVTRLDDKTVLLSQGDSSYAHCHAVSNKSIADCIDNNNVIICGGEYGNFSDILITKKEWLAMLTDIKDRAGREMEWLSKKGRKA